MSNFCDILKDAEPDLISFDPTPYNSETLKLLVDGIDFDLPSDSVFLFCLVKRKPLSFMDYTNYFVRVFRSINGVNVSKYFDVLSAGGVSVSDNTVSPVVLKVESAYLKWYA